MNIDLKSATASLERIFKRLSAHATFLAVIVVLLTYIFMVWQISQLATAEPSAEDEAAASTQIPKVDQSAINQIQALEQNNQQIHSLFNSARNNPFQE